MQISIPFNKSTYQLHEKVPKCQIFQRTQHTFDNITSCHMLVENCFIFDLLLKLQVYNRGLLKGGAKIKHGVYKEYLRGLF